MQVAGDYRIVPIIRTQLTQNIGNFFTEYFEEITNGCDEFIGNKYGGGYPFFSTSFCIIIRIFCDLWDSRLLARMTIIEWVSVNGMNMVARVVFRAINRIFVGLPFCEYTLPFCPSRVLYPQSLLADVYTESGRNDDFMQVNVEHAIKLVKARHTIERFPIFMREWVP